MAWVQMKVCRLGSWLGISRVLSASMSDGLEVALFLILMDGSIVYTRDRKRMKDTEQWRRAQQLLVLVVSLEHMQEEIVSMT